MAHEMIPERTCQRGQVTMAEWRWEEWKWHHGLVEWLRRLWAGGAGGRRQTTTPLQMKPHIGSVPHGTSQNLRKKASCHMHVILWGHFVTYNIHFHIPGQQGEYSTHTHTLSAHQQLCSLTAEDRKQTAPPPGRGSLRHCRVFIIYFTNVYMCMTAWRPHTARTTLKNEYSIWAGQ